MIMATEVDHLQGCIQLHVLLLIFFMLTFYNALSYCVTDETTSTNTFPRHVEHVHSMAYIGIKFEDWNGSAFFGLIK